MAALVVTDNAMNPTHAVNFDHSKLRMRSTAVAAVIKVGREYEQRAPGHRMSSLQDLDAKRPLEVHETLGYALRKATQNGVAMPLVDAFYHVIAAVDRQNLVGH